MNPLRDPKIMADLLKIREENPAAFANMVLEALRKYPELAVTDETPIENKQKALDRLLKYFETDEKYEDCAFLYDLKKTIEGGKKE